MDEQKNEQPASDHVWKAIDWITGKVVILEKPANIPTPAWVQGWEDGMEFDKSAINPYSPSSQEAVEWDEGWKAAQEN